MRDYISLLVQQTLNEIYGKEHRKSHVLIVMTNSRGHTQDVWRHIEALANQFQITLLVSKREEEQLASWNVGEVKFVEEMTEVDFRQVIRMIDLLYCPVISRDFLAKLSLLIDDSQPVWLALEMLQVGKEVLLGTDAIEKSWHMQFWQTSFVQRRVQSYIKELRKDGVHFCSMKQAAKIIRKRIRKPHERRPLLLARHIEEAANAGKKEILIPKNCLITPMAKDAIRELQIAIRVENDERKRDDL